MTTSLRSRDPGPELPGLVETLDGAAGQHFDLAALRTGVDGLVRHRRRRRRQALVAGGAVAAVLVGGGLTWSLQPGPDGARVAGPATPTATAEPSPSAPTGPSTTEPPATEPATTDPATTDPVTTAPPTSAPSTTDRTTVPDEVALAAADVREGYQQQLDLEQEGTVHTPPAPGQMCNQGLPGLRTAGGRQWSYYGSGNASVNVSVTVFEAGQGPQALQEVRDDTGQCRWVAGRDLGTEPWAAASPDRVLREDEPVFGMPRYQAATRVGDVLVGVEVVDERGANQAQAEAQRLVDLLAERVRVAMPAAQD